MVLPMSKDVLQSRTEAAQLAEQAAQAYGRSDFAKAESLFEQAMLADPALSSYRCNLALARMALGKSGMAADRLAGQMDPLDALDCATLGLACKQAGRKGEALTWLRRALLLDPRQGQARINLANLLIADGLRDEAVRLMREGLAEAPDDWTLANNLGLALHEGGRLEEAIAIFEQALAQNPASREVRLNLAHALLLAGRWKEGFKAYEARRLLLPAPLAPVWDGKAKPGAVLLIRAEQGFGDAIQFARFIEQAKMRAGRVILSCDKALLRLFEGLCDLADEAQPPPAHDLCCNLLSLPFLLELEAKALFGRVPYLKAPPAKALTGGFKVGFVWAGRAGHANDKNRSLDPALLAPLLTIEGLAPYSLQIGKGAPPPGMTDLAGGVADLYDTAAAIASLDLLISADTAPAHLAGAMGKPVWTLLPHAPDWRWGLGGETTPWYPSMRLFRQEKPGDWQGVIERIGAELTLAQAAGLR